MSTSVHVPEAEAVYEEEFQPRVMSLRAVVSFILGLLSVLCFFSTTMAVLPLAGIVLGLLAWRQIRRSQELLGLPFAVLGVILSAVFWVGGWSYLTWIYLTEVPEGYMRISYSQLQPDPLHPDQIPPQSALALDGKKVFIKGYVYPTYRTEEFILCRDNGDCCFGGQPKLTDMIYVKLKEPLRLEQPISPRLRKLAGTFRVRVAQHEDRGMVIYHLEADHFE